MMRGGKKEALLEEKVTIDFAYATIVTIKKIKKGEKFTMENLWVKRPGNVGILASHFEEVLGKVADCDIDVDTHITWEMIK